MVHILIISLFVIFNSGNIFIFSLYSDEILKQQQFILNWTELNWTELNWTELNWNEPNRNEPNRSEPNRSEPNYTVPHSTIRFTLVNLFNDSLTVYIFYECKAH